MDFDAVLSRIRERGLEHWADPMRHRPGEINHNDGGRGVYFPDPDGHYLEVITRPYGSGAGASCCIGLIPGQVQSTICVFISHRDQCPWAHRTLIMRGTCQPKLWLNKL